MILPFCAVLAVDVRALRVQVEAICEAARIPSDEKLAYALGIDKVQLNRQLQGEGHFSFSRVVTTLGKDPMFWPRYAMALASRFGVPPEARRVTDLTVAVEGPLRRSA